MKLATLNDGTRDGRLVVVSKDITRCCAAGRIAPTLQYALDHWDTVAPALEALYTDVEHWAVPCQRFHEREALSPLPRAYQWAVGAAFAGDPGAEGPATDPAMYQGSSDGFLPPRADIPLADLGWDADLEAVIACITGDVPQGAGQAEAEGHIRLLMLANAVTLRGLAPAELAKGLGFVQSRPASAFSPVAVTPDELGEGWAGGLVRLPLMVDLNGQAFGRANAAEGARYSLPQLVAHVAKTRALCAGSIVGSETARVGAARTPGLAAGDVVRIEMKDAAHHSIFGAIEQRVVGV